MLLSRLLALAAVFAFAAGAAAPGPWSGRDIREGKPVTTVATSDGHGGTMCSAAANWELVAREGTTCLWWAKYAKRLAGEVVDATLVPSIEGAGGTCSSDPLDPSKALCKRSAAVVLPSASPSPLPSATTVTSPHAH